jgi:hypothetical protein
VKRSRRTGEPVDDPNPKPTALKADELPKPDSSDLKETLKSSELPSLKSIKCATACSQQTTNNDVIKHAKYLMSPAPLKQRTKALNATNNDHGPTDECSFANLIDSVLNDDYLRSNENEGEDLDLMSLAKTATDDEFSTEFSAMSLETSRSTMNGSFSFSKSMGGNHSRKSMFSLVKSPSRPLGFVRKGNHSEYTSHPSNLQRQTSFKPSQNDCDKSIGFDIFGDAGEICSLEVSTLTSYQTKSTRGSGQSWPKPYSETVEGCQGSSVMSTETEVEFGRVLTDLRDSWK